MYPRNAASPERIAIGQVVLISDGTVQSSGVAVTVRGQGGAEASGAGTIAYGADNTVYYTPTQAETNYTSVVFIASKSLCFSVSVTIITTASATPGNVKLSPETHTSAVIPTVSTVTDGAKDSTVAKDATVMKTTHINATAGVVNEVAVLTGHTAQTADHTAAIADIPNNAEFNARTLAAADYFNPATDTVSANMTQINSNVQAAVNLGLSAGRITPFTVTDAAFTPTPNIFEVSTFSEATPDHHKSRIILWTTGALAADGGQITNIEASSLEAGNVRFTVTTMTEAPANGDTGILM